MQRRRKTHRDAGGRELDAGGALLAERAQLAKRLLERHGVDVLSDGKGHDIAVRFGVQSRLLWRWPPGVAVSGAVLTVDVAERLAPELLQHLLGRSSGEGLHRREPRMDSSGLVYVRQARAPAAHASGEQVAHAHIQRSKVTRP